MAQTLVQRLMELGTPFVMANELIKQINSGTFNVTRLINAGWVEELARYLASSLSAGSFKATKAVEYSMIPSVAKILESNGFSIRSVPGATNRTFFVVHKLGSTNYVYRFTNEDGGAGATDLGVKWLGWRLNGAGTIASFEGDPKTQSNFRLDTEGASGFVARAPGTIFGHEWHGLGAAGSMASETVSMGSDPYNPTTSERRGNAWSVRNTVTASDGTNTLTRDMSWAVEPTGGIRPTLHSVSGSGFTLAYFGMPVGSSTAYDTLDIIYSSGGPWITGVPLGSTDAKIFLEKSRGVRARDASGNFVSFVGNLPDIAGFGECRTDKEVVNTKTKTYMSSWANPNNAAGATGLLMVGSISIGGLTAPANQLSNTIFTTNWLKAPSGTGTNGTISAAAGILTLQSNGGAASDLRMGIPITGAAIGKRYLVSVDQVENTGLLSQNQIYAPTAAAQAATGSASFVLSASIDNAIFIGRIGQLFAATVDAPEQRFALRNATTLAVQTKWQNPAAYEIPS